MSISYNKLLKLVLDIRETERGETIDGEFFTRCDECEYLDSCVEQKLLFEITSPSDKHRHWINMIHAECKKIREQVIGYAKKNNLTMSETQVKEELLKLTRLNR